MSRLEFAEKQRVKYTWDEADTPFRTIMNVEPALEAPYFMDDSTWRKDGDLITYVESAPSWEQVEAHIKHITSDLREAFKEHNESHLYFAVEASGHPDGDIKIKYAICDNSYGGSKVEGYSLRPTLDEFFRRKTWKERNAPLALTHAGKSHD